MTGQETGKHALEEPRTGQGTANHLPWLGSLLTLRLSHEKEEGRTARPSCGSRGTITQKHPQGPIRKAGTKSLTHRSIRLCARRLQEQQQGRSSHATLRSCRRSRKTQGPHRRLLLCFKRDGKKALILISLPGTGFENSLFSFPSMFGKVSACTFSLLSFFTIEDFVKSDRGETGFCLILKISGFLLLIIPVRLSISVNILIRSTLYSLD